MKIIIFILFELTKFIIIAVPVLISVAYLTLAERKIIGYSQTRKGPNIVGLYGLLQPLADGVKLFSKEMLIPNHVSIFLYFFSPILALTLGLVVWGLMPLNHLSVMSDINLGILLIFALSSIGVYAILISGWSSNSKYAFMGALRAAAQMISYEVSIIISVILCSGTMNLINIIHSQEQLIWFIFPLLPAAFMFFISCLAETNRAPFDLTEGESELVTFALFFLAEYSHIIFMSFLFTILFLGGWSLILNYSLLFFIKSTLIVFLFVWVRTSFPALLWKTYLPLSLALIIFINGTLWSINGLPPISCI